MGDTTHELPALSRSKTDGHCKVLGITCVVTACVFHTAYVCTKRIVRMGCPVRVDSLPDQQHVPRAAR